MLRRIKAGVLLASIVFSLSFPVYATENVDQNVCYETERTPRNTYVKFCGTSLSIQGNTAQCNASVTGYSTNTNNVSIYMYLQKYSNGSWVNIASWNGSAAYYTMSLNRTATISQGTYRVKASCYAQGENVVRYSGIQTY